MENKKVISRSLIVLFLSLTIVYSLAYQKKQYLFKPEIKSWNETTIQAPTNNQDLLSSLQTTTNIDREPQNVTQTSESVSLWDIPSWVSTSNTLDAKKLPGTSEYYWMLDIVSLLGERPVFTLQDDRWNYFVYYGDHLEFAQAVKTLWGSVYEMVTETEIFQNQLFGDRVSYINLSMFKDILVLMVIEIDGDVWLLQIPADKYHQSKDYLKSLFIQ